MPWSDTLHGNRNGATVARMSSRNSKYMCTVACSLHVSFIVGWVSCHWKKKKGQYATRSLLRKLWRVKEQFFPPFIGRIAYSSCAVQHDKCTLLPQAKCCFTIYALATLSLVYNLSHSVIIASCCGEGTLDGLAMIQGGYGGVWTKSSFKGSLVCYCLSRSVHNWSLCAVVEQEFSVMDIGWGVHGQFYLFYFELWKRVRRSTCSFLLSLIDY